MRNLSRLEKRTCLSSTCYRPSMVSNAFPDQSFSPCHHREIICSCIRTPTTPAVPRRYSFYAECPSLPSTVGFSTTPFFDCARTREKLIKTQGPLRPVSRRTRVTGRARKNSSGRCRRRRCTDLFSARARLSLSCWCVETSYQEDLCETACGTIDQSHTIYKCNCQIAIFRISFLIGCLLCACVRIQQ